MIIEFQYLLSFLVVSFLSLDFLFLLIQLGLQVQRYLGRLIKGLVEIYDKIVVFRVKEVVNE